MSNNENMERTLREDAESLNISAEENCAAAQQITEEGEMTPQTEPSSDSDPLEVQTEEPAPADTVSAEGVTVAEALDDIHREVESLERTARIFRAQNGTAVGEPAGGAVPSQPEDDFTPIRNIFSDLKKRQKEAEETASKEEYLVFFGPDNCKATVSIENDRAGVMQDFFSDLLTSAKEAKENERKAGELAAKRAASARKNRKRSTFRHMMVSLLILGLISYYILYAHGLRAITSIKELDVNSNAYSMTYSGDYGLEKLLAEGGASTDEELMDFLSRYYSLGLIDMPEVDCGKDECNEGALTALNSNCDDTQAITGRNYNCDGELMSMVVTTRQRGGRETVTTVNLSRLGFTPYSKPGLFNGYGALAALYMPLDGMNDRGLCVAALELPGEPQPVKDTANRVNLTVTAAVRVLLDSVGTTEDAVALLGKFDVFPSFGRDYHLFISDREGNSAVIEWHDGQMYRVNIPYMSNECVYSPDGIPGAAGIDTQTGRIMTLLAGNYSKYGGNMTRSQITNVMNHAFIPGDGWSVIFDANNVTAYYQFEADEDRQVIVSMSPAKN